MITNLNELRETVQYELNGTVYEIGSMSVANFLSLEKARRPSFFRRIFRRRKNEFELAVNTITAHSNIPAAVICSREVLMCDLRNIMSIITTGRVPVKEDGKKKTE